MNIQVTIRYSWLEKTLKIEMDESIFNISDVVPLSVWCNNYVPNSAEHKKMVIKLYKIARKFLLDSRLVPKKYLKGIIF